MRVKFLDNLSGNSVLFDADMIRLEMNATVVAIRKAGFTPYVCVDHNLINRYESIIKANMYDECIDLSDFIFSQDT